MTLIGPAGILAAIRRRGIRPDPRRHAAVYPFPISSLADPADVPIDAPRQASAVPPRDLTGNHYLALPDIDTTTGAIGSANALHRGLNGLVCWSGPAAAAAAADPRLPLLSPFVEIDGEPADLVRAESGRHDRWIPWVRLRDGGSLDLVITICAPGGFDPIVRGGVVRLELRNRGARRHRVTLGLDGCWAMTVLHILTGRRLGAVNRLIAGPGGGIALEAGDAGAGAALGLVAEAGAAYTARKADGDFEPCQPGSEWTVANGTPLRFRVARSIDVAPNARAVLAVHIGIGLERDGALTNAAGQASIGSLELIRLGRLDATQRSRTAPEPALNDLLNRNLLFCHYCAVGRAIDDDRLYFIRSRAPDHGACAAFNEREALIWTLPALTAADSLLAREALMRAFEQYSHRPGERMRYLSGAALAPGCALDQVCAYPVALDRYVRRAADGSVLDEPLVQDVLGEIDDTLFARLHPEVFLCRSDLLPSGEAADFPYVAFGNAMVWAFANALPSIWRGQRGEPPPRFEGAAEELRAALWQYGVADVAGVRVLACATDLHGGAAVYDDPAGSLRLLPHLGFCDPEDPLWTDTMELFRSAAYPLWLGGRAFPGLAGRSAPRTASTAALCSALLTPERDQAIDVLRRLPLVAGVAADGYDPDTGAAVGPFAAPVAGFLAWALLESGSPTAVAAESGERRTSARATSGKKGRR